MSLDYAQKLLKETDFFLLIPWLVAKEATSLSSETENSDELEQITIARALLNYRLKEKMAMANSPNAPSPFPMRFPVQNPRPSSPQPAPATTSKILPLICQKTTPRHRPTSATSNERTQPSSQPALPSRQPALVEGRVIRPQKFPAAGAAPYVPIRHFRTPYHNFAPPVTIRTAVPVFSAPPLPPPPRLHPQVMRPPSVQIAPPVCVRQAVPVFAAPPVQKEDRQTLKKEDPPIVQKENPATVIAPILPNITPTRLEESGSSIANTLQESETVKIMEQLKI